MNWKPQPTMECPSCKEIEFEHVDTLAGKGQVDVLEYKCGSCGEIGFFDDLLLLEEQKNQWWQSINNDEQWIEDNL